MTYFYYEAGSIAAHTYGHYNVQSESTARSCQEQLITFRVQKVVNEQIYHEKLMWKIGKLPEQFC